MSRLSALLSLLLLLPSLSGCLEPFKLTVIQGNIIAPDAVNRLQEGMTRKQVAYVMGPPMAQSDLRPDYWHYVYTIERGGNILLQQRLTLRFQDDQLAEITRSPAAPTPTQLVDENINTTAEHEIPDAEPTIPSDASHQTPQ